MIPSGNRTLSEMPPSDPFLRVPHPPFGSIEFSYAGAYLKYTFLVSTSIKLDPMTQSKLVDPHPSHQQTVLLGCDVSMKSLQNRLHSKQSSTSSLLISDFSFIPRRCHVVITMPHQPVQRPVLPRKLLNNPEPSFTFSLFSFPIPTNN